MIRRNNNSSLFTDDLPSNLVNCYCYHCNTFKSGIIIGFCIRAQIICRPHNVSKEEICIEITLKNLHHPCYFNQNAKKISYKIYTGKTDKNNIANINIDTKQDTNRHIILTS